MTPIEYILEAIRGKKVIILGFGKEGISTYRFIRRHFPDMPLTIADRSESLKTDDLNDRHLTVITGERYADHLNDWDLIFKTPGISFNHLNYWVDVPRITSQTNLFLEAYHKQVVGVTGTKGKSTTASLIYHLLHETRRDTLLAGNIGTPFFDILDQITDKSVIVAELSAHQLEFIHRSPDYAVLLNIYQEHLDHFNSFNNYQIAKLNITRYQDDRQFLVYNGDDEHIPNLLKSYNLNRDRVIFGSGTHDGPYACCVEDSIHFANSGRVDDEYDLTHYHNLPGRHNYNNIMAAVAICRKLGLTHDEILAGLQTFKGLPNRIEFVGSYNGIRFYNDSISTIPEATIAAVRALRKVDTLILGGFDRGIEYTALIRFLMEHPIPNLVFTGPAGRRILAEWQVQGSPAATFIVEDDFRKIVAFAFEHTAPNRMVLLSPAAASYDQFKNFEERGRIFKKLIQELSNNA